VKKKEYKARIKELEAKLAIYEPPPASTPNFITLDGVTFGHFDPADSSAHVFVAESQTIGNPGGDSLDLVREALAAYAHEAWSGWMKYMFEKGVLLNEKWVSPAPGDTHVSLLLPSWAVERWQRQMNTPYADLPEAEKESDRAEADTILRIVGEIKP